MSSNRFQFLELGEEPWPKAAADSGAVEQPTDRVDLALTLPDDGEPMGPAHVHGSEPDPVLTAHPYTQMLPRPTRPFEEYLPSDKRVYDEFAARQWALERAGEDASNTSLVSYLSKQDTQTSYASNATELKAVEAFGSFGTGVGEFNYPTGLAVDRIGILFVADLYNHRVQRITPDGGVALVGSKGTGRAQFLAPIGVAVDADRSFYVVEQGNHRVQKFSADGILLLTFGREGNRNGEFNSPTGIFVSAAAGEVLISDSGNKRVQRFTLQGNYLGSLGSKDTIQPPLSSPQAVSCDFQGNIFVVDTHANRIARYDPMGRFTGHFGGKGPRAFGGTQTTRFTEPRAVACTINSKLLVTDGDIGAGRIVVMDSETGNVETSLSSPARQLGKLSKPSGIAVSPRLRTGQNDGHPRYDAYVADTMNHRIIRFECK